MLIILWKDGVVMKYFFIENPESGSKKLHCVMTQIKTVLENNENVRFITTEYSAHATEIAKNIASEFGEEAVIVACGGDGTLGEIASGIMGTKTALALLPMGSGNDFARKIYGKLTVEEIAKSFGFLNGDINAPITDIDCISANGKCCVNVMSLGLDTKILKIANKLTTKFPFLGAFAYKLAIVFGIFGDLGTTAKFELDTVNDDGTAETVTFEQEFTLAAFGNGSYYGGGFCPAKESKINDGIIDMCIADKLTLLQIPGIIVKYSQGIAHLTHPHLVKTKRVTGGRIYSLCENLPLDCNCDGNPIPSQIFDFKIIKGGLRLACFENEAFNSAVEKAEQTV